MLKTQCNITLYKQGNGMNQICHWLKIEDEISIIQQKCYWKSPLCYINNTNQCINLSYCNNEKINLQRYSLCLNYNICNPYLTIKQFIKQYQNNQRYLLEEPWNKVMSLNN